MVKDLVQAILQTQSSYRQAIHRKIREHNIDVTFEMLHVLRCLATEGEVNQQELAYKTYKDKSSLSYLIKNLEKRGLIKREEDKKDKRNKLVAFTDEGEQLYKQIHQLVEEVYSKIEEKANQEQLGKCIAYLNEFNRTIKEGK